MASSLAPTELGLKVTSSNEPSAGHLVGARVLVAMSVCLRLHICTSNWHVHVMRAIAVTHQKICALCFCYPKRSVPLLCSYPILHSLVAHVIGRIAR